MIIAQDVAKCMPSFYMGAWLAHFSLQCSREIPMGP